MPEPSKPDPGPIMVITTIEGGPSRKPKKVTLQQRKRVLKQFEERGLAVGSNVREAKPA